MNSKTKTFFFLYIMLFHIAHAIGNEVTEIDSTTYKNLDLEELKNESGIIVMPASFLLSDYKKEPMASELPARLMSQFDESSSLIIHRVFLKISRDYKTFINSALKNKASIEKHLLYNSKIETDDNQGICTLPINGVLESNMEIPKLLSIFDVPDKLLCNISISNTGAGKKDLSPELLARLPNSLVDEDVHYVNLNLSNCNMIFKAVAQRIYFIKSSDEKTLMVFENYSLVKNETIEKLDKVKLFFGSPLKFINSQVKKNMSGLLKFVNSSEDT